MFDIGLCFRYHFYSHFTNSLLSFMRSKFSKWSFYIHRDEGDDFDRYCLNLYINIWQPTLVFLPEESQGWGAWWAAIYGVTQSQTRLKRLSSSSKYIYIYSQPCIPGIKLSLVMKYYPFYVTLEYICQYFDYSFSSCARLTAFSYFLFLFSFLFFFYCVVLVLAFVFLFLLVFPPLAPLLLLPFSSSAPPTPPPPFACLMILCLLWCLMNNV